MATYDLPIGDYYVPPTRLRLLPNTEKFRSPTSKAAQRIERGGAIWVGEFKTRLLNPTEAGAFEALIAKLKGSLHDFWVYDPQKVAPLGIGTGTPKVKGANQTGNSLIIDGATISQANWLLAGTRFQVNGEYKVLTSTAATDSGGNTTLYFEPPIRISPPDNANITLVTPKCRVCLASNEDGEPETDFAGYCSFSFRVEEVFDNIVYLTDENGNYITDENGNRLIV